MVKFKWYDVLMILLFLLCVYMILTRIFGHSATDLTITIGLFGFLGVSVYNNINKINDLNREVGEIKVGIKHNFSAIRDGFDKMKQDMGALKQDTGEIKNLIKK